MCLSLFIYYHYYYYYLKRDARHGGASAGMGKKGEGLRQVGKCEVKG